MATSQTLLLIERDAHERAALADLLTEAGYEVALAGDVGEGWPRGGAPTLILLGELGSGDVMYQQVARLRAQPWLDATPIILLGGPQSDPEQVAASLDAGAQSYICRPMAAVQLLATVRARLRGQTLDVAEAGQRRFREFADSIPFFIWTAEPSGVVDYSNYYFYDYSGASRDVFLEEVWRLTLHPDDLAAVIPIWLDCVEREAPYNVMFRIRRGSDQSYRWFRVQARAIRDAAGRCVKWYGTGLDVHDTIQMEQAASRVAARLTTTLESLTDAFFTLDQELCFTYANAQAERLLRVSREQLLGSNIWALFPEAVGTVSEVEYRRAMRERVTVGFEQHYAPLDLYAEVRAYPSEEGLAVYFRDIAQRRRDEQQLRDQATLLDHAHDAIFVQDLRGRVTYWNHGAERLLGWSKGEALGQPMAALLRLDPTEASEREAMALAQGAWVGVLELYARGGERCTVDSRWNVLRDEGGEARGLLVINTDVTQQRAIEAQLMRAQRLESIGTLAGGIAHDLNNVLTPILGSVAMLREGERDPERLEDLATMELCARRGADMVRQLLAFARGREDLRREAVSMGSIAAEVIKLVRDTFPKNVSALLVTDAKEWPVKADATQIHQLLTNLCVNARDAMPAGGVLTLAVEAVVLDEVYAGMNVDAKPGPYVRLRVEDTGTGMPQEILDRIFEPFFTTKEVGKGTGLGLSTCHAIVRGHEGFIHVYSEVGKGTRFKIYFPADVPLAESEDAAITQSALPRGRGELVLVIDDEETIRHATSRTLERYGYKVLTASNGAEAVSIYARNMGKVDLVLTDMSMPIMDGPSTIVALKALDEHVRVVGSSGLDTNGKVAKALGAGVRRFVPKPYTAETLLQTIRDALDDPNGSKL
jgi:two-component system cell cycle sensor histidine kinase/response regulator CckA